MSNVIQFLESMGKDAALNNMPPEEYTVAVQALTIDDSSKIALLDRDHIKLNALLGGRSKIYCLIAPAEDDEGEDAPGKDDQKDDEQEIRHASSRH